MCVGVRVRTLTYNHKYIHTYEWAVFARLILGPIVVVILGLFLGGEEEPREEGGSTFLFCFAFRETDLHAMPVCVFARGWLVCFGVVFLVRIHNTAALAGLLEEED